MTTDEGLKIWCPACKWFLAKVTSDQARVEVNCPNWNCQTSVVIQREGTSVSATAVARQKKQQA